MGLKDLLRNSPDTTYYRNMELLEEYDLLTTFGSPNKVFLSFLKSKNINIDDDEITQDVIDEFLSSDTSKDLEEARIQKQKDIIFKERRVWVNICIDGEWQGSDMILDHEGICIQKTKNRISYADIIDIEICDGGWSKKKIAITTEDDTFNFTINEERAVALAEIIEDNIEHERHSEIDDLIKLYDLYESGEITEEEFNMRKDILYSDDVYCTNCGEKLDPDSLFCSNCGYKID